MDSGTLASSVGNALILAMTADGWQQVHTAIVKLWRRVHPERAETIGSELSEARAELLAAHEDDSSALITELAGDWKRRLQRLLLAEPDAINELQRIFEEVIQPQLRHQDQLTIKNVSFKAEVSGHGKVYQAETQNFLGR